MNEKNRLISRKDLMASIDFYFDIGVIPRCVKKPLLKYTNQQIGPLTINKDVMEWRKQLKDNYEKTLAEMSDLELFATLEEVIIMAATDNMVVGGGG